MILRAYLPKFLTALFGGIFVALGILTFGDSTLFDRLFFGILIFTAIICKKNLNVIGIVLIIAIHQILAESAWFLLHKGDITSPFFIGILFYSVAFYAYCKFRHDPVSKLLLVSLIIALASELYWFIENKNSAYLHWYVMVLIINLLTRHFIFLRVSYTESYFPKMAESINLDWHIYKLNALAIVVQTANILEYSFRRVLDFSELLIVYNLYSYIMQAISTYTIFIIFHESYKLLIPKLFRA
ncbi:MAG: hypothetical protein ACJAV1_000002 [Paraglaciecola sp.]|jgi:hypothetical protein